MIAGLLASVDASGASAWASAIVGLLTLAFNIVVTTRNMRATKRSAQMAQKSADQAHQATLQGLLMSMGAGEVQFMAQLGDARKELEKHRIEVGALSKKANKTNEDRARLAGFDSVIKSATEHYFNLLDLGCQQYLAGKCDQNAFRRSYREDIRNFVKQKEVKVVYDLLYPREQSTYKDFWKVYDEWEKRYED